MYLSIAGIIPAQNRQSYSHASHGRPRSPSQLSGGGTPPPFDGAKLPPEALYYHPININTSGGGLEVENLPCFRDGVQEV